MLDRLIGHVAFVRTVTYHLVGKIEEVADGWMRLSSASWVAESDRFMQTIRDGTLNEVEPVGDAYVNIASITDLFPWPHPLPTEQK